MSPNQPQPNLDSWPLLLAVSVVFGIMTVMGIQNHVHLNVTLVSSLISGTCFYRGGKFVYELYGKIGFRIFLGCLFFIGFVAIMKTFPYDILVAILQGIFGISIISFYSYILLKALRFI